MASYTSATNPKVSYLWALAEMQTLPRYGGWGNPCAPECSCYDDGETWQSGEREREVGVPLPRHYYK